MTPNEIARLITEDPDVFGENPLNENFNPEDLLDQLGTREGQAVIQDYLEDQGWPAQLNMYDVRYLLQALPPEARTQIDNQIKQRARNIAEKALEIWKAQPDIGSIEFEATRELERIVQSNAVSYADRDVMRDAMEMATTHRSRAGRYAVKAIRFAIVAQRSRNFDVTVNTSVAAGYLQVAKVAAGRAPAARGRSEQQGANQEHREHQKLALEYMFTHSPND